MAFPPFPQPVAYFGSIFKCSEMHESLISQIVSYLNGMGGVILMGCRRGAKEEVYASMEKISES